MIVTGHAGAFNVLWAVWSSQEPLCHSKSKLSLHISSRQSAFTTLCIEKEREEVRELCTKQAWWCTLLSRLQNAHWVKGCTGMKSVYIGTVSSQLSACHFLIHWLQLLLQRSKKIPTCSTRCRLLQGFKRYHIFSLMTYTEFFTAMHSNLLWSYKSELEHK